MSCHDTQRLLSQAQDVTLSEQQRDVLARHLAACPVCRQYQAELANAAAVFRQDATAIVAPDIDQEIRAVQARLSAPPKRRKRSLAPIVWLGAPLAAAAAVVFTFLSNTQSMPMTSPDTAVTHVDYVITGDPAASTMVYVDQDSGWLVVWAESAPPDSKG
ncbi:MAG: zf-HC2 domain-containing protein [Opitutaceae bacterium]